MPHTLRHGPLSHKPYPKSTRLRKRKRVTIAIGVLCSDGAVLCADSQETFNEYAKIQRAKVFELDLINPAVKVVVAGSGDSNFYDALRERLEDGIDMAEPDLLSIRAKIDEVIVGYCNKIWPLYAAQKDRPTAHMLIAVRAAYSGDCEQ